MAFFSSYFVSRDELPKSYGWIKKLGDEYYSLISSAGELPLNKFLVPNCRLGIPMPGIPMPFPAA
jgi:hypothetical protein